MAIEMHNLRSAAGSRKKVKRVGRGNASGKGTTAGRGTKGQGARTGGRNRRKMRGIRQIVLSTPKLRGFKSGRPKPATVSLRSVAGKFEAGEVVNPKTLAQRGLIDPTDGIVKILGDAKLKLKKKLTVADCAVTESVKKAIEEAGGQVK